MSSSTPCAISSRTATHAAGGNLLALGEYSARGDRMVDLLRAGELKDEEVAVRCLANEDPGDSEKNTRRRLKRKLPQVRERLTRPEQIEKDEILRKAFEEGVEQWDL